MKEFFKDFNFRQASMDVIRQANEIIDEYSEDGFDLTLRQLYYQFVARDLIPNTQASYKRVGSIINDARLAGKIDWGTIKDRTRASKSLDHWDNPAEIIRVYSEYYHMDLREDQDYYTEVWVEKEALAGIVERVCNNLDIPWFACRGYVSQSAMYDAAQRILEKQDEDKSCIIFHLGDHDPSGIDMTRDNQDRLDMFGCLVDVRRIALNMDQVDEYSPPPNFAKVTDSRFKNYLLEFGKDSWELDALEPRVISDLITESVDEYTDEGLFEAQKVIQEEGAEQLRKTYSNWKDIVKFLKDK